MLDAAADATATSTALPVTATGAAIDIANVTAAVLLLLS